MTVENMRSPRTGAKVANQFIIRDGCKIVFQSYESTIAEINHDNHTVTIGEDWDYSVTTGKYRNVFFEDMGFLRLANKQGLKKAIEQCFIVDDSGIKYKVVFEA
jgi:hypothetical protein